MTTEMKQMLELWKARVVEAIKTQPERSYQLIGQDFEVSGTYIAQISKLAGISRPLGAKRTKKEGK